MKAIDFFCGAGGLTRGLLDAGIEVLAGVDHDPTLRDTYEKNNEPSRFVLKKIESVDVRGLRSEVGIQTSDVVLYAACTPCQPFSTLNQKRGEDDRKDLLLRFAELVEESPPHFIVVENVPGLNTAYGKDVYRRFSEVLERCKFHYVFESMLDAKDYGVPQVRKRFIMIASRVGPLKPPRRTCRIPTVGERIAKYPSLVHGGRSDDYLNHVTRTLTPRNLAIVAAVPKDGGSRSDIEDESLLLDCHRRRPKVHKDVFGRMSWNAPAPTLTCRCTDVYCGRFAHPMQNRGLSLREAAALQTFPDHYEFHGNSIFQMAGQIGNAVPVELARRLGRTVVLSARAAGVLAQ